jgi:GNAT superfamily N-acetyltransferase
MIKRARTRIVELGEDDLASAYEVVVQLRSHLSLDEFVERVRRKKALGYRLLGAFVEGHLVAVAGMRPVETLARGRHIHLDDLVVRSEERGKGYGRSLLSAVEEAATEDGRGGIFLDSRREVIGFYERLGYEPHTAVLMRKRLR